jgi:hypothetical protein
MHTHIEADAELLKRDWREVVNVYPPSSEGSFSMRRNELSDQVWAG